MSTFVRIRMLASFQTMTDRNDFQYRLLFNSDGVSLNRIEPMPYSLCIQNNPYPQMLFAANQMYGDLSKIPAYITNHMKKERPFYMPLTLALKEAYEQYHNLPDKNPDGKMSALYVLEGINGKRIRSKQDFEAVGTIALSNLKNYGCATSTEWRSEHWGTPSDVIYSASSPISDTKVSVTITITNTVPEKALKKMSEMFPNGKFALAYASENVGEYCGWQIYQMGQKSEESTPYTEEDCVKLACNLWGLNSKKYLARLAGN